MIFPSVKWIAILACLLPLALGKTEVTKELNLNSTATPSAETGVDRQLRAERKFPCKTVPDISSSSSGIDLSSLGLGSISSTISDIIATFSSMLTNLFDGLNLSSGTNTSQTIDLSSLGGVALTGEKIALEKFKKLKLPAVFLLALLVGAIAVGVTLLVPLKLESIGGSQFMQNMLDGMTNLFNQATANFGSLDSSSSSSSQYGAPVSGGYGYPQSGYQQQYQGAGGSFQQDPYANSYQSYSTQGQDATAYNAPVSATAGSAAYNAPGASAGSNTAYNSAAVGAGGGSGSVYNAPGTTGGASSYNAPSSTYTDPSAAYGAPNKRYGHYPSLSSNYLRTAKSSQ